MLYQVCNISRQTVKAHFRKLAASQRIFLHGVHAKESKQAGRGGGTIGRSAGGTDIGWGYRAWAGDVAGSGGSSSSEEAEGGSDASVEEQPLPSPRSSSPLLDHAERHRARQLAELKKLLRPDGALKLQQQQQGEGASEGDVGERLLLQMQVTGPHNR